MNETTKTYARVQRVRTACALAIGAAAFACPTWALAQTSVTLYGVMDLFGEYRSAGYASGGKMKALSSGGTNTSRWGLRGQEDLGGGLKAIFQLESEIGADVGAAGGSFWGRQANVGLEGSLGRLIAGRSYSTTYDFMLPFDPMGYAPIYSWATSAGATGSRKDGMVTGISNLVKYRGEFGGFRVGASYGFGETTNTSDAATMVLAGSYTTGGFSAALTAEQINGLTVATGRDRTRAYHAGVSYGVGDVKLFGAARQYEKSFAAGGADNESRTYWVGASYKPMAPLTLTLAVYKQNIASRNVPTTVNDPLLISFRSRYALSKRTDLYAVLGHAKGKDGSLVGLSRDDAGFGSKQSGLAVGMQHRF